MGLLLKTSGMRQKSDIEYGWSANSMNNDDEQRSANSTNSTNNVTFENAWMVGELHEQR